MLLILILIFPLLFNPTLRLRDLCVDPQSCSSC